MDSWWYFTSQSRFFTENQNGPCGPYEHILQDGSSILWPKQWVMEENWDFEEVGKLKNQFEVQNWTSEGVSQDKMTLKKILEYSQVIVGHF